MKILEIKVSGQSIEWENRFPIVAGCREYLYCRFNYADDWGGLAPQVRFYSVASKKYFGKEDVALGVIRIPGEVLTGKHFFIAVGGYAEDDEGDVFVPTSAIKINLEPNGFGEPEEGLTEGESYDYVAAMLMTLADDCRDALVAARAELLLKDVVSGSTYALYVSDGDLRIKESEV